MKVDNIFEQYDYQPEGCMKPDTLEDVGNQPNISDSFSTNEMQIQSIPNYPGNCSTMGKKY